MMTEEFRIYHVAKLYYIDHMKQNDIAEMLSISPMLVSRTLKRAEQEGIVTFQVRSPNQLDWQLGARLKEKFRGLKEALVVHAPAEADMRAQIGQTAAAYILDVAKDDSILGISWGRNICEVAKALPLSPHPGMQVVQMSGGFLCDTDYMMMPSNLVKLVSERLQCGAVFLNAPLYVSSEEAGRLLAQDPMYRYIQSLAQRCDITLYGLSCIEASSTTTRVGVLSEDSMAELAARGAVGDIMGHFIDAQGEFVDWSGRNCQMGVSLSTVSAAAHAICVAAEPEKAGVMRCAIQRGYTNTVVISSQLAERLLAL